jgi:hypothetical protein
VRLRTGIDVLPGGTCFNADQHALRLDGNGAALAHVDGNAAVGQRCAGHVVPTTTDGERQTVVLGKVDGGSNIGLTGGSHHHRWPLLDHGIPDGATRLIGGIIREMAGAAEAVGEGSKCGRG